MKFKVFKIIFIVIIILLFILATFFLVKGLTMEEEPSNEDSVPSTPNVNLEEVISEIKAENTELSRDVVYFYSLEQPSAEGNYWHYVDSVPVIW